MKKTIYILLFLFMMLIPKKAISLDSLMIAEAMQEISWFYQFPNKLQNHYTLNFHYGYSEPRFSKAEFGENLAQAYSGGIAYGFTRINNRLDIPGLIYYASEYASLENLSTHFRHPSLPVSGIPMSTWRFSFGYRNGYGSNESSDLDWVLYHSGSLTGTHIDFETQAALPKDQKKLDEYDLDFRFGNSFESGILYHINSVFYLNASYENSLVYPNFNFWQWSGSYFLELLLQRGVDIGAIFLMQDNSKSLPLINIIVKTGISMLLYEMRSSDMFFPFESDYPLSIKSAKLGVTLLF